MSKTITSFEGKRVTFDSTLAFDVVLSRLDAEINRSGSAGRVFELLATVTSKEALEAGIDKLTGGRNFVYDCYFFQKLEIAHLIFSDLDFSLNSNSTPS